MPGLFYFTSRHLLSCVKEQLPLARMRAFRFAVSDGMNDAFDHALRMLRDGGVIAYPTEAVWGLGCDPMHADAVQRLLALKQRPVEKGLILVAADLAQVQPWLDALPVARREAVLATWPGPVTWLLPDPDQRIPAWIRGHHQSVALRVSAHPQVQALSRAFGGLLVSTSANPAGLPPARTALDVHRYFGEAVDAMVPGETGGLDKPTAIRDALTGETLRDV